MVEPAIYTRLVGTPFFHQLPEIRERKENNPKASFEGRMHLWRSDLRLNPVGNTVDGLR